MKKVIIALVVLGLAGCRPPAAHVPEAPISFLTIDPTTGRACWADTVQHDPGATASVYMNDGVIVLIPFCSRSGDK